MPGHVNVRYWRARAKFRYSVGSDTTGLPSAASFVLKQAVIVPYDRDSKKMMEMTKVFYFEFGTQSSDDMLNKCSCGRRENNVVNVEKKIRDIGVMTQDE
ncbi:unnamed protein product [Cochlearia groenlandica]